MCEYNHRQIHDDILDVVRQFPQGILSRDIACLMDLPVETVMPRVSELFTNDLLDPFEPKNTNNEWCIPTAESRNRRAIWDASHDPRTCWRAADTIVKSERGLDDRDLLLGMYNDSFGVG